MSHIVELLEKLGSDATLRHGSAEELAQAVAKAQIDAAVGAAIIARSTTTLHTLLRQEPLFHVQMAPLGEESENYDFIPKEGAVPGRELK
ncbi:hypothetical protein [Dyella sp. C11]|uniref:hypothetical protein n=1 Tax=Dyella sp. C11 TaxID=2126991 RepID=UPI000D641BF3|nr:hypothetical protein [Dyella sp. C11]